jgi:flagellar biosynthesis chaperone FliJ
MTPVAQELLDDPELAEKLLAIAGQVSLAFLAAKVKNQNTDIENLEKLITKSNERIQRLENELEELRNNYRKLQTNVNGRLAVLQNQIIDTGKSSSASSSKQNE